jgi:tripartite-type tricarboxylate transporter receptor subunit TctC
MPGPAGGGPDQVARILAAALAARWGVAVIVENKPGATGAIGAESVAHGDSSGHRLLFAFTAFVQAPYILAKPPYHVEEDFTPVIQVAYAPAFLAVAADSPSHSLAEFVARAKQSGRPQSYGSFGIGSSYHIYGEALKKSQGLNLLHVPYKGEAAAMTDLLGGQIDATFVSVGTGAPHVKAGKIRPLALVSRARSAVLPDVPTFAEAGVPDVDAVGWFGVLAPSSAPHAVVQQVADDIRVVMREPAIGARLRELGYDPVMQSDPAAFKAFVNAESRKWKSLIADTGIKAE